MKTLKFLFLISFALLTSILFPKNNYAAVNEADSLALVDLYNSTNGANWSNKTNWLTGPVNTWYGIFVYYDRVQRISLGYNNLCGTLPSSLGNLTSLTQLTLDYNNISGSIPSSLGNLYIASSMSFMNNHLSGDIPSSINSLLSVNLNSLNVNHNDFIFTNLLPVLGNINKVDYRYQNKVGSTTSYNVLKYNDYTLSVPGYSECAGDSYQWYKNGVAISGNTVEDFDGSDNGVYYCKITNSNFPNLTLTSYNITLTATNSYNISETELDALWALYNSTNGDNWTNNSGWFTNADVGSWWGINLSSGSVRTIFLHTNNLSGSIPSELGNLTALRYLRISYSNLSGSIPSSLGNLTALIYLDFFSNNLTGDIPKELGDLSALEYLKLNYNNLSGSIPAELGNLTSLKILYLNKNNLSGDIPDEICPVIANCDDYSIITSNNFNTPYPCGINKSASLDDNSTSSEDVNRGTLNQLKVYPNPAKDILTIESPYENYAAFMYDNTGKCVIDREMCGNEALDVSRLSKGLYLLVIEFEGEQETRKISIE